MTRYSFVHEEPPLKCPKLTEMIWNEFLISASASFVVFFSLIIIWVRTRDPPTRAVHYLNASLTCSAMATFSGALVSFLYDPHVLYPLGTMIYSLGSSLAILGIAIASIALIIADFEPTTRSIFLVSMMSAFFGTPAEMRIMITVDVFLGHAQMLLRQAKFM